MAHHTLMLLLFVSLLLPLLTSCCSITVQPPTLIQHSNRKGNNKKNKRRDGEREKVTTNYTSTLSYFFLSLFLFLFFFFSLQGSLTESAHGGTITSHDQVLVGPGSPTPGYWQLGNSIFNSSRFPLSSFSPLFSSALLLSLHFSPSFTLSLTWKISGD